MPFLDFQAIKEANPIEQVADQLGLELKERGNQLRGPCPVCQTGGERALAITPAKKAFYCFGGKKGGDVLELVAHINGCTTKEAAQFLSSPEKKPTQEPPSEDGFRELDYLEADHDAVIALGFEPQDAERIGIGYAPRGVMRGTVAIPVRLQDGTLVGYIGTTEAILPSKWHF